MTFRTLFLRHALPAALVLMALAARQHAAAADWPTYLADPQRSGASAEAPGLPLRAAWTCRSALAPRPAWPPPADVPGFVPVVDFDRVFQPVVAVGRVFFGSSADDTVYCLDAASGRERWTYTTEGPIRIAPTVADGRVVVPSDDGYLYCLGAEKGELLWRYRVAPAERRIPGNGRIVSAWPARCGAVVKDGVAYAAAGLLPPYGISLCAVRMDNGQEVWRQTARFPAQGYLLAMNDWLIVPSGRTAPQMYDLRTGAYVKPVPGYRNLGGTYATVVGDLLLHDFSENGGGLLAFQPATGAYLVHSRPGRRAVASQDLVFVLSPDSLEAFDRRAIAAKQLASKWRVAFPDAKALALAGGLVFVGGDKKVAAFQAADGKEAWSAAADGAVYGLAVADGRLFAGTDTGALHCFAKGGGTGLTPAKLALDPRPRVAPDTAKAAAAIAARAVRECGATRGYALVAGLRSGCLAAELARLTSMQVVCVEADPERVAEARAYLRSRGLYGARVSVHRLEGPRLPYADGLMNLIVSESLIETGTMPVSAGEVGRVLRPCGGVLTLGGTSGVVESAALDAWGNALPEWTVQGGAVVWAAARRGKLDGAGEWTHLYADAGNTACSGDALTQGEFALQWFGEPGPRAVVDRHMRNTTPLCREGRLFVPGPECVTAVDAYNGSVLWQRGVTNSLRLAASLDCGSMALGENSLFVASGRRCVELDPRTGAERRAFTAPARKPGAEAQWGLVALSDDVLLGSAMGAAAPYRLKDGKLNGDVYGGALVCSEQLFGLNARTGTRLWTYAPAGLIPNPGIAAGGGRVFFIESADPETVKTGGCRMAAPALLAKGAALVALDIRSGRPAWRREVDLKSVGHALYLSYADGVVAITATRSAGGNAKYELWAISAADGKDAWHLAEPEDVRMTGHGEHEQHPMLIAGRLFTNPLAYDLKTGSPVPGWRWQSGGHGCGTTSASLGCIFNRGGQPVATDIRTGILKGLTEVTRPGCWINIIPAGGLVLIPEGSSRCACAYAVQTSLAFAPAGGLGGASK